VSKDLNINGDDNIQIIFEFVNRCRLDKTYEDISCGFAFLQLSEVINKATRKKSYALPIKGGSPDLHIELEPNDFKEDLGFFKKLKRGTILSKIDIS
jgi:hypothetical protein